MKINELLDNTKKITIIVFYTILIISTFVFTVNYGFTNWTEVSAEVSESITEAAKIVHCEIDYKDFHFKGMCSEKEQIFSFLNQTVMKE